MTLTDAILALRDTRAPIWRCDAGPMLAAACRHATVARAERESQLPAMAVHGFRRLIVEQQATNYLGPDGNVTAMFFACHLGYAQQVLRTTQNLAPTEDQLWTDTLTGIAQRMVDNGELRWYANGNIAIGNALVMALAWRSTGDTKWQDRYEEAFEHALRPSPTRWPGRGLVTAGAWLKVDGTDQAGYLTEEGPGSPGFDTDYTTMQASQVARLWLITRDWKALRLLHVLWGQLAPLVDPATLTIDMTVGTRHPHPGQRWDLTTAAVPVLAAAGSPRITQPLADLYWSKVTDPARYPPTMNAAAYYAAGLDLGTAMLAHAGWQPGKAT